MKYFKELFITVLAIFGLVSAGIAAENCASLENGTKAYNEENFARAIDSWKTCVDEGMVNADLYYNLGNAYFRNGDLGFAIYYYKSALRLRPGDDDIQYNLNYAQSRTKDKVEEEEENPILTAMMALHHAISLKVQMSIALVLFWLIAIVCIARRFFKEPKTKNVCTAVTFGLTVILGITGASAIYKITVLESEHVGVVTAKDADVTSAPNDKSQTLNTLSEGTSFEVLSEQGRFAEIRLGEKIRGFVKLSDVGIVK